MRESIWLPRSASWAWRSIGWTFVVVGTLLIILGIFMCPFAGVRTIQAAYAFYDTAHSTTEGTVKVSHQEKYLSCDAEGACTDITHCTTIVSFTPLGRRTSIITTDHECDALNRGTKVEVLYDPDRPSVAKTARQASADITNAIVETVTWHSIAFFFVAIVLWELLDKGHSRA